MTMAREGEAVTLSESEGVALTHRELTIGASWEPHSDSSSEGSASDE